MKKLTLDRLLQSQGFGTRKACQALVRAREVAVGGEVVTDFTQAFDPEGLTFDVNGEPWTYHEHLYLALYKPAGYECSRKPSHHPGVMALLPEQFSWRDTQAVGRLDHDTTGLLLLSDDGAFIHAHTSPKRLVPKTYIATTQDPVTPGLVEALLAGVQLEDEPAPLAVEGCRRLDDHRLEIILVQGKYHQVKRMLAAAGNHCAALHRSSIGGLALASLPLGEGEWCFLSPKERAALEEGRGNRKAGGILPG